MDLDGKKVATSYLPFQAFEGFIQIQNKNNFSNQIRAFLEKNPFCTADLNH